jgi:hypothetical protein
MPQGIYTPQDYLVGNCRIPPDVAVLPMKSYVYGGDLSITNATSGRLDLQTDADAHFLVEGIEILSSLQTQAGDSALVQITDTTYSQPWSNVPVPMRDIAGYGAITHELAYPNIIAPTGTISLTITNNGGATQQFYVALHGRKIYNMTDAQRQFMMQRMFYQYAMSVPQILAGVTGTTVSMQLYNESDFILSRMISYQMWQAIMAATIGTVSAEMTCNFRDTSSDRNFYSKLIALRLVVGSYFAPITNAGQYVPWSASQFRWIKPMFIRRNGLIEGTFNNNANSTIAASIICFEGARVWSLK